MRPESELVHFEPAPEDPFHPTSTPIYQTATFRLSANAEEGYNYSRSGNPTRSVLETQLARVEDGCRGFAFASGMAALSAALSLVENGREVLVCDDLYGGTYRLLTRVLSRQGVVARFVNTTRLDQVEAALRTEKAMVLVESPSNPLQEITDIGALASIAHANGCLVAVDNSLMSPWLQKPLRRGADIVIHSGTKFLGGHGDVTAGVVVTANQEIAERVAFYQNAVGTALAPFESWLLLRGLKTLGLRIQRQQETAGKIAVFLSQHPRVSRVHYVGLPDHPNRDAHLRQAEGPGSVISFETGDRGLSERILERTRLFNTTVSFGSVSSSISMPSRMSHASVPDQGVRKFPVDLLRISTGIEHPDDLIEDLDRAF